MKNPYFVDEKRIAFSAAATAVNDYLLANADRSEIPDSELLALPEVAALNLGGSIPEGYFSEISKRVKRSHAEVEEVKTLARKELQVSDFVNKYSLPELKKL